MYLGLRHGAPLPDEYFDWLMAFETGWSLEYIRGLSMADYHEYIQVKDGINKAKR